MATKLLTETYAEAMDGMLACYDRLILTGSLYPLCYAQGMSGYLRSQRIRIFDYAEFAQELRDKIRSNAEALAKAQGIEIEYVHKKNFRKEERVRTILQERGNQPGLVHIFSAMEPCSTYKPWHDKKTEQTYLKFDSGKCIHYYFYFMLSARTDLVPISVAVLLQRSQLVSCSTPPERDRFHHGGQRLCCHRRLHNGE